MERGASGVDSPLGQALNAAMIRSLCSFAARRSLVPTAACVLAASIAAGCEKKQGAELTEQALAATPPAPAAASAPAVSAPAASAAAATPSASAADKKDPCKVPAASAASVAKLLGTGELSGPTSSLGGPTSRCVYGGAETITITISLDATASTLDGMRKAVETYPPGPMKPFPGFGDKALSREIELPLGGKRLPINSLGVLKGKTLVYLSAKAPVEKIRDLEAALLPELAAL
jgi:hypothetical protein